MTPELIISLVAVGVSIYALYQTRKYSRVSVVPHLDWHVNRHRANEGITFTFTLKNTGVGPAIILDWWFLLKGKKHESECNDQLLELAGICLREKSPYVMKRHGTPGVGSIMPAGQEICIAEIFVPGLKADGESRFEQWCEPVNFEVRYQSLHGEVFPFSTVKMA
jgi:hypothetical protein